MATLQVSLGDDLNNWGDDHSEQDNSQRSLADKMTMTDYMRVVCNIKLALSDQGSMSDSYGPGGYTIAQALSDTLAMSDVVATQNNINLQVGIADDMDNMDDAIGNTDSGEDVEYLRRYLNDK